MATGLPDYIRGMDVILQALAELIVRPKYGTALLESGTLGVTANIDNTLAEVAGKGMIYGGAVWLDDTNSQANGEVRLWADDVNLSPLSFLRLIDYGMTKPRTWPVTINVYNNVDFIYSAGISYGITFESKLKISYDENNGRTPTVHYRLVYTLI